MLYDRLVSGLAAVLAAITVVMGVLGIVYSPAILFVALPFGVATYVVYYHASGRLAARVYRGVERQAAQNSGAGRRRKRQREQVGGRRTRTPHTTSDGQSTPEAYRTLGLEPGADANAIKRAYREKVKRVHPDADGGDERRFKEVTAAYERLTETGR